MRGYIHTLYTMHLRSLVPRDSLSPPVFKSSGVGKGRFRVARPNSFAARGARVSTETRRHHPTRPACCLLYTARSRFRGGASFSIHIHSRASEVESSLDLTQDLSQGHNTGLECPRRVMVSTIHFVIGHTLTLRLSSYVIYPWPSEHVRMPVLPSLDRLC